MSDRMPDKCPIKWQNVYIYIYKYIYICHIEWMSDRMSNRISWFMPDRKSNRASEYINISAIYNPRWYVRNCVTIASRVASSEVKIVHVLPLVSQKVVETKNYIYIHMMTICQWLLADEGLYSMQQMFDQFSYLGLNHDFTKGHPMTGLWSLLAKKIYVARHAMGFHLKHGPNID